jgi:hypothetical protein
VWGAVAAVALTVLLALGDWTVAYDDDGEPFGGRLAPAPPTTPDATPVLVDSDLAPDDLAAIAFLVRHPGIRVVGITVPTTGMVTCRGGLQLLADLFAAIDSAAVPVACGDAPRGPDAVAFPAGWGRAAVVDSGLAPSGRLPLLPARTTASEFLAGQARTVPELQVVALAPLTEVAAVRRADPAAYARLAGITTMAGIVRGTGHDPGQGVGEWNAAADPVALAEVLAGPVPVTVVPDDPVPLGQPAGMRAPVVGWLGEGTSVEPPAYWDLATAALFTAPEAATTVETGTWRVALTTDRGRLRRTGPGEVRVVTSLAPSLLDDAYRAVFEAADSTPVR